MLFRIELPDWASRGQREPRAELHDQVSRSDDYASGSAAFKNIDAIDLR
jgi:hypothetical protein